MKKYNIKLIALLKSTIKIIPEKEDTR